MSNPALRRTRIAGALVALYSLLHKPMLSTRLGRALFESLYIAYKLHFEGGPIQELQRFVRPGTWIIDVGANIGVFTLRFASWTQSGGRVIAFEPEKQNFSALCRRVGSAKLGDVVVPFHAAAAERSGNLHLQTNPDHPGDHRLAPIGSPVAAVTIDETLASFGNPEVALVKIDVQGAELRVLEGAIQLLRGSHPALFIEIDEDALQRQGANADKLLAFLRPFGYEPHKVVEGRAPERWGDRPWPPLNRGYADILFLHVRGQVESGR